MYGLERVKMWSYRALFVCNELHSQTPEATRAHRVLSWSNYYQTCLNSSNPLRQVCSTAAAQLTPSLAADAGMIMPIALCLRL
jgi:hypothetical protein